MNGFGHWKGPLMWALALLLALALGSEPSLSKEWKPTLKMTKQPSFPKSLIDAGITKGWSVGGALRWQDKPTIGYPIIDYPELGPIRNIDSPVYGASETQADLWLRHRRKIFDDRIDWTLQLNVRNITDEDDLIDVSLNYGGLANIVRFNEGRRFILSSTFDF